MGFILNRIKAAIRAKADSIDDISRMGYGDPAGSDIHFEGLGWYKRGRAWTEDHGKDAGLLDLLLTYGVVPELERSPGLFGTFSVSAAGVAPVIRHNNGLASVTKTETGIPPATTCDYVTVTLSSAFKDTGYAVFVFFYGVALIPKVSILSTSSFRLEGVLPSGSEDDLNDNLVGVLAMGNLT